jgi:hypothetical protein
MIISLCASHRELCPPFLVSVKCLLIFVTCWLPYIGVSIISGLSVTLPVVREWWTIVFCLCMCLLALCNQVLPVIEFFFFSSCLFHFHFLGTTQVLHSSFILFILLFIFHLAQIHVCLQQSGFKKILQVPLAGTFGSSNRSYYQPPGSSSGYPFV